MMRMIWLAEQKRRAEKHAWDASSVPGSQEEEDFDGNYPDEPSFSSAQSQGAKRHLMISWHILTIP